MPAGSSSVLVGRDNELELLSMLASGVRSRGGSLVVRGDAGVGKSALLAAAAAEARRLGLRVFVTTGVESETRLPFAGLHCSRFSAGRRMNKSAHSLMRRYAFEMPRVG
jgi:predicted ATP-dependent serine protease